jgi:hypothetical protein
LAKPPPVASIKFLGGHLFFLGYWNYLWRQMGCMKLVPGWNKDGRNIGWAKIVAIEPGLLFAIHRGFMDTHFMVKFNNQGVIQASQGGKLQSPVQNLVLQRITLLLSQYRLWILSLYIHSVDNLADVSSHGLPAPNCSFTSSTFILPTPLSSFLVHTHVVS